MKKTTQKPKPKPTPPPEQGFTFSIPKGCKTCLSYFAVILGFFVSAFIAAGPFDGWTCMLTARIVCENIDFVGNCKLPEYSPVLDVFKDQFLSGSAKGAQVDQKN